MAVVVSREAFVRVASHAWDAYPAAVYGFLLGRTPSVVSAALPTWTFPGIAETGEGWVEIRERLMVARTLAKSLNLELLGAYASAAIVKNEVHLDFGASPILLNYAPICCKSHSGASLARIGQGEIAWHVHRGIRESDAVNQKRVASRWRALLGSGNYDRLYSQGRKRA